MFLNKIRFELCAFALSFILAVFQSSALAEAKIGQPAPDFSATDSNGKVHHLNDFKGKLVVLEWLNHGCPYVRKHYESGNLQRLQAEFTRKGVIWLSVASSAEGKEGFMSPQETNEVAKQKNSAATAILLDPEGIVGKSFGARTTPHMFIIDKDGKLIYKGAIDDNDSARASSIEGAKNYVSQALEQAIAGQPLSEPETEPYGCSVKYKS